VALYGGGVGPMPRTRPRTSLSLPCGPARPAGLVRAGRPSRIPIPGRLHLALSARLANSSLKRGWDWLWAPRVGDGGRALVGRRRCLGTCGVWTGPAWELGFCCSEGNDWVEGR